jgi:glycosyltransferase involved in cell wall biosynthesis
MPNFNQKLSIIIPTLNEEKYIPLLLESIKGQNFNGDYEIIVADAGSEDKTKEIAESYGCRVVSGGLPAKGRNQGARAASGDLLLFLDAEVVLSKNFLEKVLSEFKERNLDAAGCAIEPIEEKWIPRFVFPKFSYNLLYNWPARFLENALPYASSMILIKKDIHERLRGFNEEIKIAEDHNYVQRAAKIGKFGFLKSSKVPLFLRRCQKEGIIKTNLKYLFCNLFNITLGEVKSDIFKYHFGQYKNKNKNNTLFIPQFLWILAYYIMAGLTLIIWLMIFLIFTPKLLIHTLSLKDF